MRVPRPVRDTHTHNSTRGCYSRPARTARSQGPSARLGFSAASKVRANSAKVSGGFEFGSRMLARGTCSKVSEPCFARSSLSIARSSVCAVSVFAY